MLIFDINQIPADRHGTNQPHNQHNGKFIVHAVIIVGQMFGYVNMQHPADVFISIRQAFGTKDNHPPDNGKKGIDMLRRTDIPAVVFILVQTEKTLNNDKNPVPYTPGNIAPGSPVPNTGHQKHRKQVPVSANRPFAVAAQRDIQIELKPCCQRNMPPPPKFGN